MSDDEEVEREDADKVEEADKVEHADKVEEADEVGDAETDDKVEDGDGVEIDEEEEERLRGLLRGAFKKEDPAEPPDVLRGVQQRIRERSGGKFYEDGWSTAKHPPVYTYLVTSLLMLGIVFAVYVTLGYLDGLAHEVDNAPAPVHVMPPRNIKPR